MPRVKAIISNGTSQIGINVIHCHQNFSGAPQQRPAPQYPNSINQLGKQTCSTRQTEERENPEAKNLHVGHDHTTPAHHPRGSFQNCQCLSRHQLSKTVQILTKEGSFQSPFKLYKKILLEYQLSQLHSLHVGCLEPWKSPGCQRKHRTTSLHAVSPLGKVPGN